MFEERHELTLCDGLPEQGKSSSYPPGIEPLEAFSKNPANIFDVFRTTGQELGDDQVFRTDHRQDGASDVHWNCPLQELLLETRAR